jgi:hypothetical protein
MHQIPKAAIVAAILATSAVASANPRALPFTYPYETLAKGEAEIEQYADMTPVKALSASTGAPAWLSLFRFQTEFEYGITDHLELGLYVQLSPDAGSGFAGAASLGPGAALKQRLRYRFAEAGQWPIDVSVYGELVESRDEIEIEAKLNLQRRIGALRIMANLSAEHELYFDGKREWVLNPTLGATYQIAPWLHTGVESWMEVEFPTPSPATRTFGLGPHVYLGPTVMFNWGKIWWSNGFYFRVTEVTRPADVGDAYGRVWARTVIGISL